MPPRLALLVACAGLLLPTVASAHFVLISPASWAEQDGIGNPQKLGACGEADPNSPPVPTELVSAFRPGEVITLTIDEAIFHPGHYRAVLSLTGQSGLPPVPSTEYPGTCTALEIQNPPIFPVLADGMLMHTEPFEGVQSFEVTLPTGVSCTRCTLQVLEFMQSDVGASDNCFYRHCADLSISDGTHEAGGDAPPAVSAGCAHVRPGGSSAFGSLVILLGLAALGRRRERQRGFVAFGAFALSATGCADGGSRRSDFRATPGDLEQAWLAPIGTGPEQTRRVCERGASDPVARELCRTPAPNLDGIGELYAVLGVTPGVDGDIAVTTHSLGLSARTVSDLNPRTIVFRHYSPLDVDQIAAVAFSRGSPYVELVGYDPLTHQFNFYLLAVRPACERDGTSCEARDLLTARLESGWLDWTLYGAPDLEDTPLDCSSCHQPDGAGTPARLLMRQLAGPWMHWGDFRDLSLPRSCSSGDGASNDIVADGADILLHLDGPDGRYGGVPVAELVAAPSGYDLSSFLFYAAGHADGPGDVPCESPYCPFSEPQPYPSQDVLCEQLAHGRADTPGGVWDRYRNELLARGSPVPYFEHHIVAEPTRSSVAADFAGFLRNAGDDAFTQLAGLVSETTAQAIGFIPDAGDSAETILLRMCVRCHDDHVVPDLRRGRFRARAVTELDAATARSAIERITLPRTSPGRMPPLLAGELPDWAIDRVVEFLQPLASRDSATD